MNGVECFRIEQLGLGEAIDELRYLPASNCAAALAAPRPPVRLRRSPPADGVSVSDKAEMLMSLMVDPLCPNSTSSLAGSGRKRHCRLRRKTGSSGTVAWSAVCREQKVYLVFAFYVSDWSLAYSLFTKTSH